METHNKNIKREDLDSINTGFIVGMKNSRVYFDPAIPHSDRLIISTDMPDKEMNHFVKCWGEMDEEKQSSIHSVWDEMRELQLKVAREYCRKKEEALTQAIVSCGYQYDEVLQYLKNKQRFEMTRRQEGYMFDGYAEYVLYDNYTQRAFILAAETSVQNGCGFTSTIQSFQNKEVPFDYHR